MSPYPVTVRLLDPPMHEFLPNEHQLEDEIKALKQYITIIQGQQVTLETLGEQFSLPAPFNHLNEEVINKAIAKKELMLKKVIELYEVNPMLGHRGVRLGMRYPEIYKMQIRSILEAAALCIKQCTPILPEIMVPQVITAQELIKVKDYVDEIQQEVESQYGIKLEFKFGNFCADRCATTTKRVKHSIAFVAAGADNSFQQCFRLLRRIPKPLGCVSTNRGNIFP